MKAKILLIDDSPVSTHFFKNILDQEGYSVMISNDGKDIVDLVTTQEVDIVLLDIIMPEIDGYEVLQILQSTESTMDVPVVMITTLTASQDVKKALDCGALDFIRKTSEPIEVLARVNSALRLKRKHDQLKLNVQLDPLTKLYNKQFFNDKLERLIADNSDYHNGVATMMIDCDFFKKINDRYGHVSGDMALTKIADIMQKSVKPTDLVCRFGGEEFCVICPNSTPFQAYATAERIRTGVEKAPFLFQEEAVSITISCGISHTDCKDGKSSLKLVNEADMALYKAKANGRNQTVIFSDNC